MSRQPWKLWNGFGPIPNRDGVFGVERIGPEGGGGLFGAEGRDIIGQPEDLVLAASAPLLLGACWAALGWIDAVVGGVGVSNLPDAHPKLMLERAIAQATIGHEEVP